MELVARGYTAGRSPDIHYIPKKRNFAGAFTVTSHSGPWKYLQEVPLVFYGPGFIRPSGRIEIDREVSIADVAPTLAELIDFPFPRDRPGQVLADVLLPPAERNGIPRLILTVVWDGGGWNVLRRWPDAWPHLRRLNADGASIVGATVGSTPSVTPAVHATIGTGAWPRAHGIVDIPMRHNGRIVGAYPDLSPKFLRMSTLADLYGRADERARLGMFADHGWHLGMLGHGAYEKGGRRPVAVFVDRDGSLQTNDDYFSLPRYLLGMPGLEEAADVIDAADGRRDRAWLGHALLDDPIDLKATPAWTLYQTDLLKAMLQRERFGKDKVADLFFTNYKQLDLIGHKWNMVNPEVEDVLRWTDMQLDRLVRLLDKRVGRRRWVLVVTADHGQQPDARAIGGWPFQVPALVNDVAARFGLPPKRLVLETRATGLWLNRQTLRRAEIDEQDVANYLLGYTIGTNVPEGAEVPEPYRDRLDERIFRAVFPTRYLNEIERCVRGDL